MKELTKDFKFIEEKEQEFNNTQHYLWNKILKCDGKRKNLLKCNFGCRLEMPNLLKVYKRDCVRCLSMFIKKRRIGWLRGFISSIKDYVFEAIHVLIFGNVYFCCIDCNFEECICACNDATVLAKIFWESE